MRLIYYVTNTLRKQLKYMNLNKFLYSIDEFKNGKQYYINNLFVTTI